MIDRKRFMQTLTAVYTYYGQEMTQFAVSVWLEDLAGFDIATIEQAFARHRRDLERGQWMPKTADILRQIHGDAESNALVEWGKVLESARSGGKHFAGPTQAAIDSIGGMYALRVSNDANLGFLQRQFVAAYRVYRAREELPPLLGSDVLKAIADGSKDRA